jgi:hypothetical protein
MKTGSLPLVLGSRRPYAFYLARASSTMKMRRRPTRRITVTPTPHAPRRLAQKSHRCGGATCVEKGREAHRADGPSLNLGAIFSRDRSPAHTVRKSYAFYSKWISERAKEAVEGQASPDCTRLPQLRWGESLSNFLLILHCVWVWAIGILSRSVVATWEFSTRYFAGLPDQQGDFTKYRSVWRLIYIWGR